MLRAQILISTQHISATASCCPVSSATLAGRVIGRVPSWGQPIRTGGYLPKQGTSEPIPGGQSQPRLQDVRNHLKHATGGKRGQTFFIPSCPAGLVLWTLQRGTRGRPGRKVTQGQEGASPAQGTNKLQLGGTKSMCSGKEARSEDHVPCDSSDRKHPEKANR